MPPQIGDQISTAVYDGKLKSNPLHKVTSATMACHFVDVDKGLGIKPPTGGTSLIVRFCLHTLLCHSPSPQNHQEKEVVLQFAAKMQAEGLQYRIITPYDAQRELIEKAMKELGLHWADKVHNVDSFQGTFIPIFYFLLLILS
jgi:hypothetical protein